MTAGFEDAVHILEDAVFVGHKIEYAVGDDDVGDVSGDGHLLDVALPEFDVMIADFFSIGAGLIDHGGGEVDADDLAGLPDFGTGDKAIVPGAGSQVDDDVAFLDPGELCGQSATEPQVGVGVITFEGAVVVAHDVINVRGAASGAAAGGLIDLFVLQSDLAVSLTYHFFYLCRSFHAVYFRIY
jgi:hypothetical protein